MSRVSPSPNPGDLETDAEVVKRFQRNFEHVAGIQGRVAYVLMSVHAIQPEFLMTYVTPSATRLLYFNMVYGIGAMIYARPNMQPIGVFNRIAFSILGSLMFNYSSMAVFNWIRNAYGNCACGFATILSFLAGRVFMLHLSAFLYHVDRQTKRGSVPRNAAFDSMYR